VHRTLAITWPLASLSEESSLAVAAQVHGDVRHSLAIVILSLVAVVKRDRKLDKQVRPSLASFQIVHIDEDLNLIFDFGY